MTHPLATPTSFADLRARFQRLAADWKQQSRYMSNTAQMAMLKPYQRIIGIGPIAIPLILQELDREPGHWFWALNAITGEDPVTPGSTFNEAVEAWLNWGRDNGYI